MKDKLMLLLLALIVLVVVVFRIDRNVVDIKGKGESFPPLQNESPQVWPILGLRVKCYLNILFVYFWQYVW